MFVLCFQIIFGYNLLFTTTCWCWTVGTAVGESTAHSGTIIIHNTFILTEEVSGQWDDRLCANDDRPSICSMM